MWRGVRVGVLAFTIGCGVPADPAAVGPHLAVDEGPGARCSGVPAWVKPVLKIMPIGDSITAGAPDGTTYRSVLADLVNQFPNRQRVDFVGFTGTPPPCCHEGFRGKKTEFFAMGAVGWVEVFRPDAVLLLVGTNDLDSAVIPLYVSGIINPILNGYPNTMIFAAPLIYNDGDEARRRDFNAGLTGALRGHPDFGGRLRYVEAMASALGPGADFDQTTGENDGVHPGPTGAAKMAAVWAQAGTGVLW